MVTIPWLTVKKSGLSSEEIPVPSTTFIPEPKSSCSGSSFRAIAENENGLTFTDKNWSSRVGARV